MPAPAPAPLEAHDPDRARVLKGRIRDRVSDVRRHLIALRTAMAEFGADFDLDAFQRAYDSDDPLELNRVKAVERGVDQLYNFIAELAAFGLELAEVRARRQETNARADIDALQRIGVIGRERARRLQRLRELRRLLVHEYATATAEQVHEAARIIANEFIPFTMPIAPGSPAASSQTPRHDRPALRRRRPSSAASDQRRVTSAIADWRSQPTRSANSSWSSQASTKSAAGPAPGRRGKAVAGRAAFRAHWRSTTGNAQRIVPT